MPEETIELPPSLERLLTSEPVDERAVAESLVSKHYVGVYRLALATLREENAAHEATVNAFASALANAKRYRGQVNAQVWLFSFALKSIRNIEHQTKTPLPSGPEAEDPEKVLWDLVDTYGRKERQLLILYFALDWKPYDIAPLLRVSEPSILTQLEIFERDFTPILPTLSPGKPRGGVGQIDLPAQQRLETYLGESFRARWPAPELSPEILDETTNRVITLAESEREAGWITKHARGIMISAVILMTAVVFFITGLILWRRNVQSTAPPYESAPFGNATPVTPAPAAEPLTRNSDSQTIMQRLKESNTLWNTLWMEAQVVEYGPESYIGPEKSYHAQIWISQPEQSLEFFGSLGQDPNSLHVVSDGQSLYMNPLLELSISGDWDSTTGSLIHNDYLRNLIYPADSGWLDDNDSIRIINSEQVSGRNTIQIEWINSNGRHQRRVWIDTHTGIILRVQEFGGGDNETVVSEIFVTQIAFDVNSPPAKLGESFRLERSPEGGVEEDADVERIITPTPTMAIKTEKRPSMPIDPAPPNFDPANSQLIFQFPGPREIVDQQGGTADTPAELFADGYYLGEFKFGLPWLLRCDRSPDGQRIAFNTDTDGTTIPDPSVRWFNLVYPDIVYQPLPELHATQFSFAPESRRLAVFGYGEQEVDSGIYIVNIGTGEKTLLIQLVDASSLIWSPDGEYISVLGTDPESGIAEVMVIHVNTGLVTHRIEEQYFDDAAAAQWPTSEWGTTFPVEMGSMDECAAPPER